MEIPTEYEMQQTILKVRLDDVQDFDKVNLVKNTILKIACNYPVNHQIALALGKLGLISYFQDREEGKYVLTTKGEHACYEWFKF